MREAARGDSEKRSVISRRFCGFGRVFAVKHDARCEFNLTVRMLRFAARAHR